jgi:hypothetical protein
MQTQSIGKVQFHIRKFNTMSNPATSTASSYVNMATRMASSPDAAEAGRAAKQTAREIHQEVTGNEDWSLRVMTLIAGIAMVFASLNGFTGKLVTFQLASVMCDAFVFCVGVTFMLLESGLIRLSICAATDAIINDNAPFLRNLAGRGAVFIGTGMLEIYQRGLLDTLVGCFAIYVGGMYFVNRHKAEQKLEMARRSAIASGAASYGLEHVQENFALADVEGKGSLTLAQFRQFADSMGLALNKRESEAAFMHIDKKNQKGRISYEAIHQWWMKGQK